MSTNKSGYEPMLLGEYLTDYYKRLFPFKPFVRWLTYGKKPSEYFSLREFAFVLKDDIYLRYRSFNDQADLEQAINKEKPQKLDIGAVFNHPPKDGKKFQDFESVERELVFDIDLTDYDDIRVCCSGGAICRKCWQFMTIAVTVLDKVLKGQFGFKRCLWVFSGRRGVHCWIGDRLARQMTVAARRALTEYLNLIRGGEQRLKRVQAQPIRKAIAPHPLLHGAYREIISGGIFEKLLVDQKWLDDENGYKKFLRLCPDEATRKAVENDMLGQETGLGRWKAILYRFDNVEREKLNAALENDEQSIPAPDKKSKWALMEYVLERAYPRLDVNVSTGLNHLLKSPFCVHPKTGRVSVPFDARLVDKFDVENVPRIDLLITELAGLKQQDGDAWNRKALDYKHTSLGPYVEVFESFVNGLIKDCENDAIAVKNSENNSGYSIDF